MVLVFLLCSLYKGDLTGLCRLLGSSFWWTGMWRSKRKGKYTAWMKATPSTLTRPLQSIYKGKSSQRYVVQQINSIVWRPHLYRYTTSASILLSVCSLCFDCVSCMYWYIFLYSMWVYCHCDLKLHTLTNVCCTGWKCPVWCTVRGLYGGRCSPDSGVWRNLPVPSQCEEPKRKGMRNKTWLWIVVLFHFFLSILLLWPVVQHVLLCKVNVMSGNVSGRNSFPCSSLAVSPTVGHPALGCMMLHESNCTTAHTCTGMQCVPGWYILSLHTLTRNVGINFRFWCTVNLIWF